MRTAALVMGCQDYPHLPDAAADGAVANAVAMREWLLAAGGVDHRNLRLLLSPAAGDPPGDRSWIDGPADLECFTLRLRGLLTGLSGDRLYVYVSAQGCLSDPVRPFLAQPLILFSDFDPAVGATGSLAVEELMAHLAHADFREVITLLDCGPGLPVGHRIVPAGLGAGWRGRRRTGSAMQFRIHSLGDIAPAVLDFGAARGPGALTAAFLSAVVPPVASRAPALAAGAAGSAIAPAEAGTANADHVLRGRQDGTGRQVRWSFLERSVVSAMPFPPTISGPNPSLQVMPLTPTPPAGGASGATPTGSVEVDGNGSAAGEIELRCADLNAMLIIEDGSGARRAVGVGSISGHLPAGSYTALIADPCGTDPRAPLTVTSSSTSRVALAPRPRPDGFRISGEPALLWSSTAAQLAMATSTLWAYGHRSYLLVGAASPLPGAADLLEGFPDRFAASGALTAGGSGWWVALPVSGPWHSVLVAGHRLTVPAAPDSVSAVAMSASAVSVALFDTTHPEPAEIAAQDRVQEYLALGRLGAADLTSRSAVQAGQRWPWGASAAIRRLIDRTRASRAEEIALFEHPAEAPASNPPHGNPPHEFRADVPPPLRRLLVGRGPWAVWLDWPAVDTG